MKKPAPQIPCKNAAGRGTRARARSCKCPQNSKKTCVAREKQDREKGGDKVRDQVRWILSLVRT